VESIFFTTFGFLLLFNALALASVLPIVYCVSISNNNVSLRHGHKLRFDRNKALFKRATDGITQNNEPLVCHIGLSDQNAVIAACFNLSEALHVLNMFLVNGSVPEDNTHVITLRFTKGKYKSLREVAPQVFWLNVSEEDICIDSKCNSQSKTFPTY
jgi:hypothetical protein